MRKKYLLPALFLFAFINGFAQKEKKNNLIETDSLIKYEQILKPLGDSIRDGWNEFVRLDALTDFIPIFVRALKFQGSYQWPFDSLNFMYKLNSPDKTFRMFNWVLKFDDGTYRYYAAIQLNSPGQLKLIPLYDKSNNLEFDMLEDTVLTNESWYGVQYYDMFMTKYKRQNYYVLLGWDGHNSISHKKIIEVMYFVDGKVYFGAPFFRTVKDKKTIVKYRKIFQYSANALLTLKYHPEKNLIVFDHLVPPDPKSEGKLWLYIPNGDYDYYKIKKGKFIFGENVFAKYKINTGNPEKIH